MWYQDTHFLLYILLALAVVGITVYQCIDSRQRTKRQEAASYAVTDMTMAKAREIMSEEQRSELDDWSAEQRQRYAS